MFNAPELITREIEEALSVQAASKRAAIQRDELFKGVVSPPPVSPRTPDPALPTYTAAPAKSSPPEHLIPAAPPTTPPARPGARTDSASWIVLITAALAIVVYVGYQFGRESERGQLHSIPAPGPAAPVPPVTYTAPAAPAAPASTTHATANSTPPPPIEVARRPPSVPFIQPSEAGAHAGQVRTVCGQIAGLKDTASGTFLSFDRPYPRETFSVVIWRQHQSSVGRPPVADDQRLCVSGLIQTYRDKPRIEVTSRDQFLP